MMFNTKQYVKLHKDLENFTQLAVDNRNIYIHSKVLNVPHDKEQKIVFTTPKEEEEYKQSTIARLAKAIHDFILNLDETVKEIMLLRLKNCRFKLDYLTLYTELNLMSMMIDSQENSVSNPGSLSVAAVSTGA